MIQYPEQENELRNALLIASAEKIITQVTPLIFSGFKLNLPSEISLLPHLLCVLFNSTRRYNLRGRYDKMLDFLIKEISLMVDNAMYLKEIIYDFNISQSIRSAAILAFLLHPNGSKDLNYLKELLVEFCNSDMEYWYIRGVVICLHLLTTEKDPDAECIVDSILEATRSDYVARQCLDELLNFWRESSHSPIQKAGVLDKWLSGTE